MKANRAARDRAPVAPLLQRMGMYVGGERSWR